MGFPRQEYRSGLPFPPPGDLPDPGIEPTSLTSPALAGGLFTTVPPGKYLVITYNRKESEKRIYISESLCHVPETKRTCKSTILQF